MPAVNMKEAMNRGLITKFAFNKDGSYGPRIHMFMEEPGTYYDAHGAEVPAVVAKAAGFDIEQGMIQQTVMGEQKRLMARYAAITGPKAPHVVEETRPLGHTLVCIGPDKYHLERADGTRVTSTELSRHYAVMWLDDIDPMPEGEEAPRTARVKTEEAEEEPVVFPSGTFKSKGEEDADT